MAAAPANSFVISSARYEELKGPLAGFLRAWSKSAEAGKIDPKTVAMMVAKVSPDQFESQLFGESYLGVSIALNTPITPKYGELQTSVWENIQKDMIEHDLLSQAIDVSTFLDSSLIPAANEFDREQIKADLAAWAEANK